ncbi:transmembrane sensor [Catalinimonas alkaloidigena]|uniref:FecR family protein n=1 Tax=Catalinimonas alkaloidigena TaxID=1075417 RepID=UPI002406745D|nr:FecR domain-containing protein [Catalinimonas alkaloidigena]MDF9798889.1 transmembrane sensor [Catalinimonas alkaloidigena]
MKEDQYIKALFEKFIAGKCSREELEMLMTYINKTEDSKNLPGIEEVQARLEDMPDLNNKRADNILEYILDTEQEEVVLPKKKVKPMGRLQMAAAIGGVLLLLGVCYQLFFAKLTQEYSTAYGEVRTIELPDGSEVMLNANSSLRLHDDWDEEEVREVWLTGEGFFSVLHTEEDQQFVVHTRQGLSVEVLGTKFNVNDRQARIQVVLNEGKVKVKAPAEVDEEERLLMPGEMLEFSQEGMHQQAVNTELYTSWRHNRLQFENTPLDEVFGLIRDNYGYEVQFEDSGIADLRFSGSNAADDPKLLLQTLSKSFKLDIHKRDNVLLVKYKKDTLPAQEINS